MSGLLSTLNLAKGDSVKEKLVEYMENKGWKEAIVTGALGSVVHVTVGNAATMTNPPEVRYTDISGPFEILSFCGEIYREQEGNWYIHIHMAGSMTDATVFGGGMQKAEVFKGLKVFITGS